MTALETPLQIGGVEIPNRLYRAPVLECAGNGEAAVDTLIDELEPTAASGVGLLFQGASIVTDRGGCAAPNMTRVHDPAFVERLERLTGAIHDHGGRVFLQLAHGGLRSMATWHAEYRQQHPDQRQLAVSRPPWQLRALDRVGLISLQPDVLSTSEVWALAEQFGRCAGYAVDAGYDGIHLSAANMSLIQQFLSPFYNRRDDEFGDGVRFLEAIHDAVREHAGDVSLVTKVPAETAAPGFVRRHLSRTDGIAIAERAAAIGYDGLVPVEVSPFWDMSIVRGAFPDRAWAASDLQDDYAAVFGGRLRASAVQLLNRLQARRFDHDPGWNADFCRAVRERVDVPVLLEGGLRTRADCDRYLGAAGDDPAADAVGMARPFYAEPRLGARLLDGADALCESCNNCTVPQVAGEPGRCRTPAIVRAQARLRRDGAYERSE
ncbi:NADH:flavin oxidoreductase [Haloarcula sp. S1AR25-5A]|uniref:NADH:flavin oxidoreductase n=1 Tax=Haloarcula terrestris TaxID=2950533 RepID=A0AAE4JFI9_9EURY|nr:NADH:flavin oxidoreductase [Haloarcula terrestris]MDS0220383.1 NADH:flavin oxidoreductase [Haloarcula terrestris]